MKLLHALPPVAALISGGLWTGFQHQHLSTLERESDLLRGAIKSARHADAAGSTSSENGSSAHDPKAALMGKKVDWKKVLETQKNQNGEMGDVRLMIQIQKTLSNLTADELVAQLDEIAAMDVPEADKNQLASMLIGVLAQKDPEKVMERFAGWIASDRMTWQLNDAFQKWAAKDVTAASAWMERQLEAGTFDSKSLDGRNGVRSQFEASLVTSLLQSNPQAAEERIKALPEEQRSDLFNSMSFRLKPGTEKATVEAMRATLPAGQYKESLENVTQQVANQGLEKVAMLISQINATPQERSSMVSAAFVSRMLNQNRGKTIDSAKLEEVRAWGMTQAPEAVNRNLGRILGDSRFQDSFEATSQLAVKYARESGNDDLMTAYLGSSGAHQNPAAALALVDRISDPVRREEVRKNLQIRDGGNH